MGKKGKQGEQKTGFNSIRLLSGDTARVKKFEDVCATRKLRVSSRVSGLGSFFDRD